MKGGDTKNTNAFRVGHAVIYIILGGKYYAQEK